MLAVLHFIGGAFAWLTLAAAIGFNITLLWVALQ